jgi:hypothetical protein
VSSDGGAYDFEDGLQGWELYGNGEGCVHMADPVAPGNLVVCREGGELSLNSAMFLDGPLTRVVKVTFRVWIENQVPALFSVLGAADDDGDTKRMVVNVDQRPSMNANSTSFRVTSDLRADGSGNTSDFPIQRWLTMRFSASTEDECPQVSAIVEVDNLEDTVTNFLGTGLPPLGRVILGVFRQPFPTLVGRRFDDIRIRAEHDCSPPVAP